jgi:hypothetical protein
MGFFRETSEANRQLHTQIEHSQQKNASVRMTITFYELITPRNGGRLRTKKDIVRAILDIVPEHRLFHTAEILTKHELADNYNVLRRITHHLSATGDLHKLRVLSEHTCHLAAAQGLLRGLYQRLYVSPTYVNPRLHRDKLAFAPIASGCTELVAKFPETFGNHEYPPGAIFKGNTLHGRNSVQVNDWKHIFALCPNLTTLTVVTGGCPTAVMWNRTSTALTALRTAFEEAKLEHLTILRMLPADAVYIGQFKWNGPAFGAASSIATNSWSRITQLELQVLPFAQELSKLDRIQAAKVFNAWSWGLAPHLETLRLCYLGDEEGEHPFALLNALDIKASGQPTMKMPLLKELWLGNVRDVGEYAPWLEEQAPSLNA